MDFNFLNPTFWIKIVTLVVIGFYAVFTFVVYTQVKTMEQILHLPHAEAFLKVISLIHIILAVSLFLIAVVIL